MKNKKFFILILLMVIGFASISATLVINGNTKVAANLDDFSVIFIEGFLNGETNEDVVISGDKKTLTFKTNTLTEVSDTARIDYKVKNISTQYDGDVIINCTNEANNYVNVISSFDGNNLPLTNSVNMQAQEVKSGYINAELTKVTTEDQEVKITCKIEVSATSRTNYVYTLSFDSNGGTNVEDKIVEYNSNYGVLSIPEKDGYKFIGWFTDNNEKIDENTIFDSKGNKTLTAKWKEKCQYEIGQSWDFNYANKEQEFPVPCDGKYKLETWGAQGGGYSSFIGGYGAYAAGVVNVYDTEKLYVNVGGAGRTGQLSESGVFTSGGYNGGGDNYSSQYGYAGTGGGATHIATSSGYLDAFSNQRDSLLIVSAGGGGGGQETAYIGYCYGGHAGGIAGMNGTYNPNRDYYKSGSGGTQSSGYSFGKGHTGSGWQGAGGSGLYGGIAGCGGGGGSSYIGNSKLNNKAMYCYNCTQSPNEATKTISTTCTSASPTSNCAKQGNGYAKITYLGE